MAVQRPKRNNSLDKPEARNPKLRRNPLCQVTKEPEINWSIKVDEEGVVNFLCKEKGFSEKRVRGGLNSLRQV